MMVNLQNSGHGLLEVGTKRPTSESGYVPTVRMADACSQLRYYRYVDKLMKRK